MTDSVDSLFCNACQCPIASNEERTVHYKSEWHRYNVKRRVAGLQSIPQSLFNNQLSLLQEKKNSTDREKTKQHCAVCNKTFQSQSAFQVHLQSKKHIKKQQSKGNNNDNEEDDNEQEEEELNKQPQPPNKPIVQETKTNPNTASNETDLKEDGEEEFEDDGLDMDESAAIPLLTCLFCRTKFEESEKQIYLDHMLKQHGFFIPFVEFLTDLDGFLTYCGEKIGIGRMCLWCNGRGRARYPTVSAVQQHMKQKSHCKIRLDTEEEEEEFMDFYAFPREDGEEESEEEEEEEAGETAAEFEERKKKDPYALPASITGEKSSKKKEKLEKNNNNSTENNSNSNNNEENNNNSKPKRRLAGMNDLGELLLTDGSTVGHRSYKQQYKQNYKPEQTKESVIINQLATQYRYLSLTDASNTNGNSSTALALANNTKKDAPAKFREAWWENQKRKNHLKVGMIGNTQFHFRAQVQF